MARMGVSHRLFVYGTLRAGQIAHGMLAGARFLGRRAAPGYRLVDLGDYPAIVPGEGSVPGELYEVDDETLAAIDRYEEHPTLFVRFAIVLDDGTTALAYRQAG